MVTDEERREVAAMLLKVMLEVRPGDEYTALGTRTARTGRLGASPS